MGRHQAVALARESQRVHQLGATVRGLFTVAGEGLSLREYLSCW